MMNSLWEEISNIIFFSVPFKNSYTIDMHTNVVNEIIKLIEKRIDSMIKQDKELEPDFVRSGIIGQTIFVANIETLERVKKEMLKK